MLSLKFLFVTQGLLLEKRYIATQACKQAPSVGKTFSGLVPMSSCHRLKDWIQFFYIYVYIYIYKISVFDRKRKMNFSLKIYPDDFIFLIYPRFQNSVIKTIKLIKTRNSSVISVHYPVKTNESWAIIISRCSRLVLSLHVHVLN